MDFEDIMLNEISQTVKDTSQWNLFLKKINIHQAQQYREQIGICQKQGVGKLNEDSQKVQTFSYKINKFWGW